MLIQPAQCGILSAERNSSVRSKSDPSGQSAQGFVIKNNPIEEEPTGIADNYSKKRPGS